LIETPADTKFPQSLCIYYLQQSPSNNHDKQSPFSTTKLMAVEKKKEEALDTWRYKRGKPSFSSR